MNINESGTILGLKISRASDILRGSKQWWTLASKISRGSGPSNPRRIDAYANVCKLVAKTA